nr:hypothetical protein [Flavobacterium sp. ASV13]
MVAPAVEAIVAPLVTLLAVGGLFPTGIVKVADAGAAAPKLSVAVKVKVSFPVKVPLGAYVRLAA